MKNLMRLIAILLVLFLGAAVFGQKAGMSKSCFADPSTLEAQVFNTSQEYLDLCTYSFWCEGNLYVLSYELDPSKSYLDNNILIGKETKRRNVYLYRQDGDNWVKASELVKTDFYSSTGGYDHFYPSRREALPGMGRHSEIEVLSERKATIKVLSFYGNHDDGIYESRWDTFLFTDYDNDGMYSVTLK